MKIIQKWFYQLTGTRAKMLLARWLYRILHVIYREDRRTIVRNAIRYEIDLREGIDLALFFFGNFQKHVVENKYVRIPQDAVIFDVGANMGSMALQFAKTYPTGRVYAFEPTHYAFAKLKRNVSLNPALGQRMTTIQCFLSDKTDEEHNISAYASWKVGGPSLQANHHPIHQGTIKFAEGIGAVTMDDFCSKELIKRLDLIKIDTDGHELEVLRGAERTIRKLKPIIIFEVMDCLMRERGVKFPEYLTFFDHLGYRLFDSKNLKNINIKNHKRLFVKDYIEVLAIQKGKREF